MLLTVHIFISLILLLLLLLLLLLYSIVIPEGLIESIPELKLLLQELDTVYKEAKDSGHPITGVIHK